MYIVICTPSQATHNETLRSSWDSALAAVGVCSGEDAPELGYDCLLSQRLVVVLTEGKVANQTHQCLTGEGMGEDE